MAHARRSLSLTVIPGDYCICRLPPTTPLRPWMTDGVHAFIARTPTELSVIADASHVPTGVRSETGFALIRFDGPLDFSMTGVLASVLEPLATAGISILAVSTFDLDYVLVQRARLDEAMQVLADAGHTVHS